jgi:ribosomal protein L31
MDKKEQKCVIYLCHVATDVTYKQAFCYHFNDLKEYAAINETPLGADVPIWTEANIAGCDIFIAFISSEAMSDDDFNEQLKKAIKHYPKVKIITFRLRPYLMEKDEIARFTRFPIKNCLSQAKDQDEAWVEIINALQDTVKGIYKRKNNIKIPKQQVDTPFFQQLEQKLTMDEKYWEKANFFFTGAEHLTRTYDFLNKHKNALLRDREMLAQNNNETHKLRETLYGMDARLDSLKSLFLDIAAKNHPVYRNVLAVQDANKKVEKELNAKKYHNTSNILLETELLTLENKLHKLITQIKILIDQTPQFEPN